MQEKDVLKHMTKEETVGSNDEIEMDTFVQQQGITMLDDPNVRCQDL